MDYFNNLTSETLKYIIMGIVTGILLILSLIPIAVIIVNRGVRTWLKKAIEGENKQLDVNEVNLMIRFYIIITCLPILIAMIFTAAAFELTYPVYGWIVVSLLLVGAEAKEFTNIVKTFRGK